MYVKVIFKYFFSVELNFAFFSSADPENPTPGSQLYPTATNRSFRCSKAALFGKPAEYCVNT